MTQITALINGNGYLKFTPKQLKLLQLAVAKYALETQTSQENFAEYGEIHNKILKARQNLQNGDN